VTGPPRLARALLDRILPSEVRDTIAGELHIAPAWRALRVEPTDALKEGG
jgi:hypothetical protein